MFYCSCSYSNKVGGATVVYSSRVFSRFLTVLGLRVPLVDPWAIWGGTGCPTLSHWWDTLSQQWDTVGRAVPHRPDRGRVGRGRPGPPGGYRAAAVVEQEGRTPPISTTFCYQPDSFWDRMGHIQGTLGHPGTRLVQICEIWPPQASTVVPPLSYCSFSKVLQ